MKIPANWKKHAPGVYDDGKTIHIVSEEILDHLKMPRTEANKDMIGEQLKIILAEQGLAHMPVVQEIHL